MPQKCGVFSVGSCYGSIISNRDFLRCCGLKVACYWKRIGTYINLWLTTEKVEFCVSIIFHLQALFPFFV